MGKITKVIGVTGIAAGVAAGVTYLSKEANRQELKGQLDKAIGKSSSTSYVKNLGKPEGVEDAQMVDEGAMTSVQYYNQFRGDANTSE